MNFQLEFGSVKTEYEPYKESTATVTPTLRSLPNGTRDEYVIETGVLTKKVSDGTAVVGVVAVNTTNYPLAKDTGSWINELDAGGYETGVIGTDSTSGDGTLYYELATPTTTEHDAQILTGYASGTFYIENSDTGIIPSTYYTSQVYPSVDRTNVQIYPRKYLDPSIYG